MGLRQQSDIQILRYTKRRVEIFTLRYALEWVAPDDDGDVDAEGGCYIQGNNLMYSKLYLRPVFYVNNICVFMAFCITVLMV